MYDEKNDTEYTPSTLEVERGIYLGDRGEKFKMLIQGILNIGKLKKKYTSILLRPDSLEVYGSAFTSELVDENNNYQVFEQIGDLTANKFIVCYIYRRFPQLKTAQGVKIAARLRINYGSKQSFCGIAEKLGLWDYISATKELRQRKKKSLLEDVLEAFLGATETILDQELCNGIGYAMCYKILAGIFDQMDISLKYEDLYDAKTRLKELFDMKAVELGPLVYEETKMDILTKSCAYRLDGVTYETKADGTVNLNKYFGKYRKILIGQGSASLKADAQQLAAADALKNLSRQGHVKKPPKIYATLNGKTSPVSPENERVTSRDDVLKSCENDEEKINDQFYTRGKSKYQNKYTSTVLGMYCRKRDYSGIKECIKLGADPNILDIEELTCTDLLLIGDINEKLVKKVVKKFCKVVDKVKIHKNIFEVYGGKYPEEIFSEVELIE